MAPSGSSEVKAALRREALARRDAMGEELRTSYSQTIVHNVTALPAYRQATTVLAYASFGSELQTADFLGSVLEGGKTLVLPRVNRGEKSLDLYEVKDPARDLEAGVWGIGEPRLGLARVELAEIDFVLVPGAAFDPRGARLGYGGGFYDKLLGGSPERLHKVAGAFEVQIVGGIPVDHHDVLMDLVITECRCIRDEHGGGRL